VSLSSPISAVLGQFGRSGQRRMAGSSWGPTRVRRFRRHRWWRACRGWWIGVAGVAESPRAGGGVGAGRRARRWWWAMHSQHRDLARWAAGTPQEVLAQRRGGPAGARGGAATWCPGERTFGRVRWAIRDSEAPGPARRCGFAAGCGPRATPRRQSSRTPRARPSASSVGRRNARCRTPRHRACCPPRRWTALAMRGARTATGGRVCLLGAISHGTGVVLGPAPGPRR
jgi:hypothetical protein